MRVKKNKAEQFKDGSLWQNKAEQFKGGSVWQRK